MKHIIKHIMLPGILLLIGQVCLAGPIKDLESKAVDGRRVPLSGVPNMEVIVVSDCLSENTALNPNVSYKEVDLTKNGKTVYVQEADGSKGLRLVFEAKQYNELNRYDKIVLNLNGGWIEKDKITGALTVSKLTPLCVVSRESGSESDVPVKERLISELTDDDVYTLVSLKDMEFAFKDGAIVNIKENYGQYVDKYHSEYKKELNYRMDGAMNMLKDAHGSAIGMAVNTLCEWRRDGEGVPQGSGIVTGILVDEQMRRYGNNTGRYIIRPRDRADIKIDPKKKSSAWTMLAGNIRDEYGGKFIDFVAAGSSDKPQTGDRVCGDTGGKSLLWTDCGASVKATSDWNNILPVRQGAVWNGAIMFDCMAKDWFQWSNIGMMTGTNSIFFEFSSKKVKPGQKMQLCFEWTAGDVNMANSWGYPAQWKVECSVNGGEFVTLKEACTGEEAFSLRPLPCWCKTINTGKGNKNYNTQYDFSLGTQGHIFNLPDSAAGQDTVLIRITPASNRSFALRSKAHSPSDSPASAKIDISSAAKGSITIGSIFIDYK